MLEWADDYTEKLKKKNENETSFIGNKNFMMNDGILTFIEYSKSHSISCHKLIKPIKYWLKIIKKRGTTNEDQPNKNEQLHNNNTHNVFTLKNQENM